MQTPAGRQLTCSLPAAVAHSAGVCAAGKQLALSPGHIHFGSVAQGSVVHRTARVLNVSTGVARFSISRSELPLRWAASYIAQIFRYLFMQVIDASVCHVILSELAGAVSAAGMQLCFRSLLAACAPVGSLLVLYMRTCPFGCSWHSLLFVPLLFQGAVQSWPAASRHGGHFHFGAGSGAARRLCGRGGGEE